MIPFSPISSTKCLKLLHLRSKILILLFYFILTWTASNANDADTLRPDSATDVVKITRSWTLPSTLQNISAIDFIPSGKIACLQSEIGSIFIFNLVTGDIDDEIVFGPPGDYEGLVIVGKSAYIACADGRILEVDDYHSDSPKVTEYGTHLTVAEDVSGICYDRKNKRLLVTARSIDDANQFYKGIYAFSLGQKRMAVKPAIRIDLRSNVFSGMQPRNLQSVFQPSDIDIHPVTGLIYMIDGTRRQLLRMRQSEAIKDLTELNRAKFFQPEGITFTPSGELFIASRGERDEPALLLRVRIR